MNALTNPYVLAGLTALAVGLTVYAMFIPKKITFKMQRREVVESTSDNASIRFMSKIGSEVYASLPAFQNNRKRNDVESETRIENLLTKSGNPWKITPEEFVYLQIVFAFFGTLFGFLIGMFLPFPSFIPAILFGIFGFFVPSIKHKDEGKRRDLAFTRELPEALDLIIISLSGGVGLPEAIRESIPNMQDGVMKEEFKKIISDLDSGKTLDNTLQSFGERSPNEGIKTFVASVRQANELDTPMEETFNARADASRKEFIALVKTKAAMLSSKIFTVLTPTLIPALMIVSLAPFMSAFSEFF